MTQPRRRSKTAPAFGQMLRHWRKARGLSQLELGVTARVPQRHVSFLETGRARPREEMVLRLASALDVPPRERSALLQAAGFAAREPEPDGSRPSHRFFETAVRDLLEMHTPYPALVLDGRWQLVDANRSALTLIPSLTVGASFVDALFAPGELRRSLENWEAVAQVAFARLSRDARERPTSERLTALVAAAASHLSDANVPLYVQDHNGDEALAICPRVRRGDTVVRMFSMVATFAAAQAPTLSELRVELMFPADEASAQVLTALNKEPRPPDTAGRSVTTDRTARY